MHVWMADRNDDDINHSEYRRVTHMRELQRQIDRVLHETQITIRPASMIGPIDPRRI